MSPAEVALAKAGKAHKRGKHKLEHRILTQAAESTENATLLNTLARTNLELGRMREGAQCARQAYSLSTDPAQRSEAAVLIGNMYLEIAADGGLKVQRDHEGRARYRRAAEWFRLAVEDRDQAGTLWMRLALALASAGDYLEAQSAAKKALEATAAPPCQDHLQHLISAWGEIGNTLSAGGHEALPIPVPIRKAVPKYPEAARRSDTEGAMMWSVLINNGGSVQSSCALKRLPDGLTEATQRAVDSWTFEPLTVDGQTIPFSFLMTVTFSIDSW